jgi:hypothetical protein
MSNYIKFFKEEFEKHAAPAYIPRKSRQTAAPPAAAPIAPPVDTPQVPSPSAPVAPRTAPTRESKHSEAPAARPAQPVSLSVPAVKEMQKAILNIANILSSSDVTALQGNKEGLEKGPQSRAITNQQVGAPTAGDKEYLGGNDPFGNFIVQKYLPKESVTGKQFINTDVAGGANRMNAASLPKNLRGVIDSMKRIGTPGSAGTEKSVDGIWQDRTNNALYLIADLASAMMRLITDMGIAPVAGIPVIGDFVNLIPKSYTDMKSPAEISQTAQKLLPYLNSIATFFTNLKPAVLDNKEIRKYVDQKEPFAKYVKTTFPPELGKFGLPGVTFDFIKDPAQNYISLEELSTPDAFRNFLMRVGVDSTPETMKEVLLRLDRSLNTSHETKSQLNEIYK